MMTATTIEAAPEARPILKWVGGKRSLLPRLLAHTPEKIGTYYEPFAGGAAFFFALRASGAARKAVLCDANARLMRTYRAVQSEVEAVIRRLRRMPNDEAFFLRQRKRDIDKEPHAAVAAWMLYLNRTCYNGLYRVNRKGEFNAPFGHYANPTICDADNLRAASRALANVKLRSEDFMYAVLEAKRGDFAYFDPPYMPRVGNEFVSYQADGFTRADQERLAKTARTLKERGVRVLLSNSDTEEVRELYEGFDFEVVQGKRSVGRDQFCRGAAPDLLIW